MKTLIVAICTSVVSSLLMWHQVKVDKRNDAYMRLVMNDLFKHVQTNDCLICGYSTQGVMCEKLDNPSVILNPPMSLVGNVVLVKTDRMTKMGDWPTGWYRIDSPSEFDRLRWTCAK